MQNNSNLATINEAGSSAAIPYVPYTTQEVNAIIAKIRSDCVVANPDISTKKGRDAIISAARLVSTKKMATVKEIESAVEHTKKEVKRIDAERIRMVKALDALRDEIRKPVTDWEAIEEERVNSREMRINVIAGLHDVPHPETREMIEHNILTARELAVFDWQEFAMRADATAKATIAVLEEKLAGRIKYEEEQAELARLRKEAAEREERDRIERAAKEAADKAREEERQKAEREREEAARRAQAEREAVEAKAKAEREEAERTAKAERDAIEAKAREEREKAHAAELQAKEAAAEAERQRLELVRQKDEAEKRAKQAEEDAARRQQEAIEAERKRVADEKAREDELERKRAENRKHQATVNNSAVAALREGAAIEDVTAKLVVALIAQGKIPNVTIRY